MRVGTVGWPAMLWLYGPDFVDHVTEVVIGETGAGGVDIEPRLGRVHGNRCELTRDDRNIDAARHPRESNLKDFVGAWITPVLFGNGLVDVLGVKCVHVPRVTVAGFDPVEGPGIGQNNVVVSIRPARILEAKKGKAQKGNLWGLQLHS